MVLVKWIGLGLAVLALGVGALLVTLAPPLPLALPEPGIVLSDAMLIEPGSRRIPHRRLVVEGDHIAAVTRAQPSPDDPYRNSFVIPGLNDVHVHFPPAAISGQAELFAFLYLLHGVTGVRDMGDVDGTATGPARDGIASGAFPGPRMLACGYLVDGDPPMWGNSLVVTTPEEGRAAVARIAREGFDCVKAYDGLDTASLAAIRDEASRHELPVVGHVPRRVAFEDAKLDDAQHLIGVPPAFEGETPDFPFILEAWLRTDAARIDFVIEESLRERVVHTPTLVSLDRLIAAEDYPTLAETPDAKMLPNFYRSVIWNPVGGMNAAAGLGAEDFAMLRAARDRWREVVGRMIRAGVTFRTGTDSLLPFAVPGASLHRELRLFVEAGLTPEQALELSTRNSAQIFRVKGLGALRVGAPAEFIIFREDPTRDLAALDTLLAVVRDGRLYTRETLEAQLARYQAHYDGALFDGLVTPFVRRVLAATVRN